MLKAVILLATVSILLLIPFSANAKDTYYVYVDELPSWADYAVGVMYDSTRYWEEPNPELKFYVTENPNDADFRVQWVKDFGGEQHVGHAYGKQFVEVGLGDSNCYGKWQPYSRNYVSQIMTHEIGHILGLDHSNDVKSIMYPTAIHLEYGIVEEEFTLTESYGQFYSPCTIKGVTSIDYWVSVDDPTYGFDVYFVPSVESFDDWADGKSFQYYSDEECFGKNYRSYGGTCNGVTKESGLLVIANDVLSKEIATITVQYKEQSVPVGESLSRIDLKLNTAKQELQIENTLSQTKKELEITNTLSETVCGKGTIEKDGICVPEPPLHGDPEPSSKGGGCLIATATYGSELAPQVQQLRELRDNKLLQTESGTSFMNSFNDFYYSFSPIIADYERENPLFKEMVKIGITPMISSLSILNYVDMDSEVEVLGYGISLILLNVGMYFGIPIFVIVRIKNVITG
ncbi:MAG: matrixin family metalloprotease [Thaumarchaeota archaeon]|nr:matrixin family metalloprotease [Nitrososphaerota archaeon]